MNSWLIVQNLWALALGLLAVIACVILFAITIAVIKAFFKGPTKGGK